MHTWSACSEEPGSQEPYGWGGLASARDESEPACGELRPWRQPEAPATVLPRGVSRPPRRTAPAVWRGTSQPRRQTGSKVSEVTVGVHRNLLRPVPVNVLGLSESAPAGSVRVGATGGSDENVTARDLRYARMEGGYAANRRLPVSDHTPEIRPSAMENMSMPLFVTGAPEPST